MLTVLVRLNTNIKMFKDRKTINNTGARLNDQVISAKGGHPASSTLNCKPVLSMSAFTTGLINLIK